MHVVIATAFKMLHAGLLELIGRAKRRPWRFTRIKHWSEWNGHARIGALPYYAKGLAKFGTTNFAQAGMHAGSELCAHAKLRLYARELFSDTIHV